MSLTGSEDQMNTRQKKLRVSHQMSMSHLVCRMNLYLYSNLIVQIVLSGGFGSSHYVQTQLDSRYSKINDQRSDATRIEIVLNDEP